jgi:hypothetical protein
MPIWLGALLMWILENVLFPLGLGAVILTIMTKCAGM